MAESYYRSAHKLFRSLKKGIIKVIVEPGPCSNRPTNCPFYYLLCFCNQLLYMAVTFEAIMRFKTLHHFVFPNEMKLLSSQLFGLKGFPS